MTAGHLYVEQVQEPPVESCARRRLKRLEIRHESLFDRGALHGINLGHARQREPSGNGNGPTSQDAGPMIPVVETGVDPVTPRFSGVCSAD